MGKTIISMLLELSIDPLRRRLMTGGTQSEIRMPVADQLWAVDALQALGHETRLSVFRLLVKAGPDGLMAGEIAQGCSVPASTMSHHLANLERAGLATSQRESRVIRYRADYAGMRQLLAFLMEDCCQGDPLLCADLSKMAACEP